ncbi:MAG: hypothetical protein OXU45_09775, partial [Candidatus Melainabacteria bacterium]|nr:hypothetical protein [Candidatus Melainabacteria bacterium]
MEFSANEIELASPPGYCECWRQKDIGQRWCKQINLDIDEDKRQWLEDLCLSRANHNISELARQAGTRRGTIHNMLLRGMWRGKLVSIDKFLRAIHQDFETFVADYLAKFGEEGEPNKEKARAELEARFLDDEAKAFGASKKYIAASTDIRAEVYDKRMRGEEWVSIVKPIYMFLDFTAIKFNEFLDYYLNAFQEPIDPEQPTYLLPPDPSYDKAGRVIAQSREDLIKLIDGGLEGFAKKAGIKPSTAHHILYNGCFEGSLRKIVNFLQSFDLDFDTWTLNYLNVFGEQAQKQTELAMNSDELKKLLPRTVTGFAYSTLSQRLGSSRKALQKIEDHGAWTPILN